MTEKWRHFLCIRKSLNGWGRRSVQVAQAEPDQNIFIRYHQNHADSRIPSSLLFKSSRKSSHLTLNINQFQDDLVSAEPMLPLHYYIQRNPCKTSSFAFPVSRSNHPINITLFKLNNSGKHWSQLKVQDKVLAITMEPISSPLRYTETFRYNIFYLHSFVC